jgi:LysM repeat protein
VQRNLGGTLLILIIFFGVPRLYAETFDSKPGLTFPTELRLKVEFWKAIYTKYKTTQGLLHDAEDLSVIYDAIELPKSGNTTSADELRYIIRERLFNIVRKRGENLTPEERKLLAHFPPGTTRTRLLQATENIRFQLGQADRFKEGIIRSGYYLKHIEKILHDQGLPDFVKYLPHVESSFQEYAISKGDAAGLWQLMESTGRGFGLRIDYAIDERLDPWLATAAAAKHLKRDHTFLGTWPLALTAYNHGPGGVQRAVQTLGTTDIADIAFRYTSPTFGFASRNFYAQFLAAVEVAGNYQKYFGDLPVRPALTFDTMTLTSPTYFRDLTSKYKFTVDEFKRLNPSLRAPVIMSQRPIPKGTLVRLPPNSKRTPMQLQVASLEHHASLPKSATDAKLPQIKATPMLIKKPLVSELIGPVKSDFAVQDTGAKPWVKLQINETISQVADWLGVPVDQVRQWNNLGEDEQARLGQKLFLKFEAVPVPEFVGRREDYHKKIREDFFARYEVSTLSDYQVKQGENLWSICYQKFDVPPWLLQEYNAKISVADLSPGVKLKIPVLRDKGIDLAAASQ